MKYIDSHCHLYKFNEIEIKRIIKDKDIRFSLPSI